MPSLGAGPIADDPWENPTNQATSAQFAWTWYQHPVVLASLGVLLARR